MKRKIYDIRNIVEGDDEESRLLDEEKLIEKYKEDGMNKIDLAMIKDKIEYIKNNNLSWKEEDNSFDIILEILVRNVAFDIEDIGNNDVIIDILVDMICNIRKKEKDMFIYNCVNLMFLCDDIFD